MANTVFPRGLQPHGGLLRARRYNVAAATTASYIGDPVVISGTSNQVSLVTGASAAVTGVIIGIYDSTGLPVSYRSASGATGYFLVADHPDQVFIAQQTTAGVVGLDAAGANVDLTSAAGSAVNYLSGYVLASVAGTSVTTTMRLIRPVDRTDNDYTAANCDWLCSINNHQLVQGTVGAGI